jgi:multidrug efflux pump
VVVRKLFKGSERQRKKYAHEEELAPAVEVKHD